MSRILIADDEEHILSVMRDVLEQAGYEVVGVRDGEMALRELQFGRFDLALIDVMMPKMDGYHVAAKIHGVAHPPKIVIVTSRDYEGDQRTIEAVGVSAFLPKPFSNHELINVVRNLLTPKGKKK